MNAKGIDMTVIVFGAEKGGVGKTSLALNFTVLAASANVDVVLLDTDRQKTASNWLSLRIDDVRLPSVSVLANSADPLHEISSLSRRYELVVVDIGAQNYRALVECAMFADVYVVPTSTSALDIDTAEDLFQLLNKIRPKEKSHKTLACIALTKVPNHPQSKEVLRTRERLAQAQIPVLDAVLPNRSAWRSMANSGMALHELTGRDQDARAIAEMQQLYDEIVSKVPTTATRRRR